jgi:hypothetical protein
MQIEWDLAHPMPPRLYQETKRAAGEHAPELLGHGEVHEHPDASGEGLLLVGVVGAAAG